MSELTTLAAVNLPPTYRLPPITASAVTSLSTPLPVEPSALQALPFHFATRFANSGWRWLSTTRKDPPTYKSLPLTASE